MVGAQAVLKALEEKELKRQFAEVTSMRNDHRAKLERLTKRNDLELEQAKKEADGQIDQLRKRLQRKEDKLIGRYATELRKTKRKIVGEVQKLSNGNAF